MEPDIGVVASSAFVAAVDVDVEVDADAVADVDGEDCTSVVAEPGDVSTAVSLGCGSFSEVNE